MRTFAVAAAVVVTACVTTNAGVPIDYVVRDDPAGGGFAISYTNPTRQRLCLTLTQWPTDYGFFDSTEEAYIFIRVGTQRFPLKPNNPGYCPGGCGTAVAPRQTLTGFIPYERFALPSHLWGEPKQLELDGPRYAYPCEST